MSFTLRTLSPIRESNKGIQKILSLLLQSSLIKNLCYVLRASTNGCRGVTTKDQLLLRTHTFVKKTVVKENTTLEKKGMYD